MNIEITKRNDPIIQALKQRDPALYEAMRKPDRIDVPLNHVHGFGVSGDVFVQDNAFPPLIFTCSLKLVLIILSFNTAPVGADFICDIRKRSSACSILKAPIVYPDGFTDNIERSEFGVDTFIKGDVLLCDMKQIGSTTPGSMMSLFMYFDAVEGQ